jgi:phosphate transport system permease protein
VNSDSRDYKEKIFYFFNFFMALVPIIIIILLTSFLLYYSIPSMRYNGFKFFTSYLWYPGQIYRAPITVNGVQAPYDSSFGMLLFFLGTLLSSAIALLIAFPVSIFTALTINLYIPHHLKKLVGGLVELFAGIPSVVYGLWGIIVLEPILFNYVEPWMNKNLRIIPFFSGAIYSGAGIIASGLILSIMIIPIITAVISDTMSSVSVGAKDGAFALGATKWEVGKNILLKYSKIQTLGATLLGLGRALGETMAVLMVCGSVVNILPSSIYSPINTMAAAIASLLDSAFMDPTGMNLSALAELALLLFFITMIVNIIGRTIVGRGILRGYEYE